MKEVILTVLKKAANRTQVLGDNRMHDLIVDDEFPALAEAIVEQLRNIDIEGTKYRLFKLPALHSGTLLIGEERQRQIEVEGWTPEHDDLHKNNELAIAAATYCLPDDKRYPRINWPFAYEWWKPDPEDRIHELVKAGALIAAEIERIQRL